MELRNLGNSGLRVSLIGLGTNTFGKQGGTASGRLIDAAIDLGVNLFDTADTYGKPRGSSEEIIGQTLGAKRQNIVLVSKFAAPVKPTDPPANASRRYMMSSIEGSLRRLKTDWIDLYLVHRNDPDTPLEETIRGLEDLTRAGKIRYAGLSNYPAWRVVDAQWTAKSIGVNPLVTSQEGYSLFDRRVEEDVMPAMAAHGLGLIPYAPLAGGLLTGKYKRDDKPKDGRLAMSERAAKTHTNDRRWAALEKLEAVAHRNGRTMLDLAFGFLASRKIVGSIIAGATSVSQLESNVKAGECRLSPAELSEIEEITAEFRKRA